MCFSNEGNWCATIQVDTFWRGLEDTPVSCHECGRTIAAGEWRKHIYQQENEECRICEYEDGPPCEDDEHDYGKTYSGNTCRECLLVLAAIYDLEAKENCPEYSRQPLGGELYEELDNDIRYGHNQYVPHALAMFPELKNHKLIIDLVDNDAP